MMSVVKVIFSEWKRGRTDVGQTGVEEIYCANLQDDRTPSLLMNQRQMIRGDDR